MMNKKKNTFLYLAIYTDKCNWQPILHESIKPLILELADEQSLHGFYMAFNSRFGNNIRLAVNVPITNKFSLAQRIDTRLTFFLKNNNLFPIAPQVKDQCLFMPFLQNSIAYGNFSDFNEQSDLPVAFLKQKLSNAMLEAFTDDEVDDELILTFALYTLLDCFKIANEFHLSAVRWISGYCTNEYQQSETFDQILNEQYLLLSETLDEIYSDIFMPVGLGGISWLKEWEDCFRAIFQKLDPTEKMPFLYQISEMVIEQLNIGKDGQQLIGALIEKTLKKQFPLDS